MSKPYGDGWNTAWSIAMGICTALVLVALLAVARDVYGQDDPSPEPPVVPTPEPVPTPDPLPLATGSTIWLVDGLLDEEHVNGMTLAAKDSTPRMAAYGYVAVNYNLTAGDTCTTKVVAETEARKRLSVTEFADGFKVDGTGKVWADVEVRYSRRIMVDGASLDVITRIESDEITFVIEDTSGPDPPPDEDEEPGPQPSGDSPFAESGLRVMIVYERDDLPKLDEDQTAIIFSAPLRKFLNEACTKKEGQPEYRILDKDAEPAGSGSATWVDALARARGSLPWILIGDGSRGFEGPLPASVDETIDLVKEYQ